MEAAITNQSNDAGDAAAVPAKVRLPFWSVGGKHPPFGELERCHAIASDRMLIVMCLRGGLSYALGMNQDVSQIEEGKMLALLLVLLLLIVLFGGLGVFVAKWFFILLVAALLVSLLTGGVFVGGHRH